MKKTLKTLLVILSFAIIILLQSCCQSGVPCNPWTEKECMYSDYYQTPPLCSSQCPSHCPPQQSY